MARNTRFTPAMSSPCMSHQCRRKVLVESLEDRHLLAADGVLADEPPAIIQGFKWEDTNANGAFDRGESGLGGVTIYADLNGDSLLNPLEPATVTQDDGHYQLEVPGGGEFVVREIVPDGFVQTYPLIFLPGMEGGVVQEVHGDAGINEFATVSPSELHLMLGPGEEFVHPIDVVVHPFCFVPVEIDLVPQDPTVEVQNLSGVQTNGCGGDVSTFNVHFVGAGETQEFALVAIDAASGHELGFVKVTIDSFGGGSEPGGHFVALRPGDVIEGLDFGNRLVDQPRTANLEGRKWSDSNGDGQWNNNEPSLGGVTVYLDLNNNGQRDRNEPWQETRYDDPFTDFDEGGFYSFNVRPGAYSVREVIPRGYEQTFPSPTAELLSSISQEVDNRGGSISFDLTAVDWVESEQGEMAAALTYSSVWSDGCSRFHDQEISYAVVDDHIIVDMTAEAEGEACPEVISNVETTVTVAGLKPGAYTVVTTLHESLPFGEQPITLTSDVVLSDIAVRTAGAHHVTVESGEIASDLNFGNKLVGPGASLHGTKWLDKNGNGVREDN
ncbi:MAG: hypothetical protein KDB27_12615, partial [Planctomycetales bacterium]|nr:hypothetical protein [Planctomycetales bacterium]